MNVSASGAQGAQGNLKSDKPSPVEENIKAGAEKKEASPEPANNEIDNANNGLDLSA